MIDKKLITSLQDIFDGSVSWQNGPLYSYGDLLVVNGRKKARRCAGVRHRKGVWFYVFMVDGYWETFSESDISHRISSASRPHAYPEFNLGMHVAVPCLGIESCLINGFVLRRRTKGIAFAYWTIRKGTEVLFDESDVKVLNAGKNS